MRLQSQPTVVDLFAGAGLLSYAFAAEGFEVVRAVEIDRVAAATYAANLPHCIEVNDVRKAEPTGRCHALVAGPPCQGFSTLGKRNRNDSRNRLSFEVLRWARAMRPEVVIIENVAAFLESQVLKSLVRQLQQEGYEVWANSINSFSFGVPQIRSRSFTIASRVGTPVVTPVLRNRVETVRQAWEGLPRRPDGRNHHYAPKPSELALARMKVIRPGGDKRDVMRHAPRLAAPSWWELPPNHVTDVWGRMEWDHPSNTLRTALQNPSKGRYIHPDQNRVISLREAARLHSIPDNWAFFGLPTQIARQIGNSVPPTLGRAVARAVRQILR